MGVLDTLVGGGVFNLVDDVVKRVFPDPAQQQAARLQLMEMQQQGAFKEFDGRMQQMLAQAQIDQEEAKSGNWFIAGARPAVEWVCVAGLAYQLVIRNFLVWGSDAWWHIQAPPSLDMGTIVQLLTALLGIQVVKMGEAFGGKK